MKIYITDNKTVLKILLEINKREDLIDKENLYYALNKDTILFLIEKPFYNIVIENNNLVLFKMKNDKAAYSIGAYVEDYSVLELISQFIKIAVHGEDITIINTMSCTGYGEITCILFRKYFEKNNFKYERVWYDRVDQDVIEAALNDTEYKNEFQQLGMFYLAQRVINNYFRQLLFKQNDEIANVSLTQLYILKLLEDNNEKRNNKSLEQKYRLELLFEDKLAIWEDIYHLSERDTVDELNVIAKEIANKSIYISEIEENTLINEPNLLFNTADIVDTCKSKEYPSQEVIKALEKLFEKGVISQPHTISRHVKSENRGNLEGIVISLLNNERYSLYKNIIDDLEITIAADEKIIGNVDIEAITIKSIPINMGHTYSELEQIIYDAVALRCIAVCLGNYVVNRKKVKGNLAGRGFIAFDWDTIVNYGHKVITHNVDDVLTYIYKKKNEMLEGFNISAGKFYKIQKIYIKKVKPKKVNLLTIEKIIKLLEFKGHVRIGEKSKIKIQNKGIDNVLDRLYELKKLVDNRIIIEYQDHMINLSEKGEEVLNRIPNIAFNKDSIEYYFNKIAEIKTNNAALEDILIALLPKLEAEVRKLPKKYMEDNKIDYIGLVETLKCPICRSRLVDAGTQLQCKDWRVCRFKIDKVKCGHILTKQEIEDICSKGETGWITDFIFKGKPGAARLKVDKKKRYLMFVFN